MSKARPQIAAYYFPGYHVDPRNEVFRGPDWTEWELVRAARPRFPGHEQPKIPAWGYEDEAAPVVFARKIDAAADHGVDCFLFDWYWYENRPFLQRPLDEGYLAAPNHERVRFALMWANHIWADIFPAKFRAPATAIFHGPTARPDFDDQAAYVIEHYFHHPSYWTISGCPYFSFYDLPALVEGLGGMAGACAALDAFRDRARADGFRDLHLNAVIWGTPLLPGAQAPARLPDVVDELGFDSVTSYVCIHHIALPDFPETRYEQVTNAMAAYWEQSAAGFRVPYIPNVTMGWDSTPRTEQDIEFQRDIYPYIPVLSGNTPAAFETALRQAATYLRVHAEQLPVMTINAWNEWTESSYLEPDIVHGYDYLRAIKRVFGVAG